MYHRNRNLPILLALASLLACDGAPTSSDQLPEGRLTFLRFSETAPALAQAEVSFWAVRGSERHGELRYAPAPGQERGEVFLDFEVEESSLLRYPDGRLFTPGDSVLITVRAVDPSRFIFEFQPAGLRFDPGHPAKLKVSYEHADRDYDDDGDEDGQDEEFERRFGFWRQERAGADWERVGSVKVEDLEEVEATIEGFTKYAVAGN